MRFGENFHHESFGTLYKQLGRPVASSFIDGCVDFTRSQHLPCDCLRALTQLRVNSSEIIVFSSLETF